jgi:threonine-phosphate decarboxylase
MTNDAHGGNTFAYNGVKLDFSVNLNPLGIQKAVVDAIKDNAEKFDAYPDTNCRMLTDAVAELENVNGDMLVFGNGAADIIVRLCMALKPNHALVTAPAFSEYEKAVTESGGQVSRYMLDEANGFQITKQYAGAVREGMDIVFLCNPNNPTGRLAEPGTVEAVAAACRRVGAILVVDECFIGFTSGSSCKNLLGEYDNLIILKAFTKMYSMAGLRLGYCICSNPEINRKIFSWGQSWSVSAPAQYAGRAACTMTEHPENTRRFLQTEREWMMGELEKLVKVFTADGNFILFKSIPELWDEAIKRGIMLRSCANFHGLDNRYYRIGLKQRRENQELIRVLSEILL